MTSKPGFSRLTPPRFRAAIAALRNLRPYIVGNRWLLFVIGISALLGGFAEAGVLYLVVQAATAIAAGDASATLAIGPLPETVFPVNDILLAGVAFLAVLTVITAINAVSAASLATRTLSRARKRTFTAFVKTSRAEQSRQGDGRLQQILTDYVSRIGLALVQFTNGVTALLNFAAYLVSALLIDATAAGTVLGGVAVVGIVLFPLARLSKRLAKLNVGLGLKYAQLLAQCVRVARDIRVFGVGDVVSAEVEGTADQAERLQLKSRILSKLTPQVYQYAALFLVIAGMAVIQARGGSEVSALGAIVLLLVRALSYGQQFATVTQQLANARPYIGEVVNSEQRYVRHRVQWGQEGLEAVKQIQMQNVSFAYYKDRPVLRGVTFGVDSGEAIGIVGPSGSGKSTLVQILLRLREPDSGEYLVNNVVADQYADAEWTSKVALVPQDNHLLLASLMDNIRFFRPHLSDDDAISASRRAHLHEDVKELPDGYDTIVGPGAQDLSGGQLQRLGLARALACSPEVLILDEPTSALDMRSEGLVQESLRALKSEVTIFVIAHRIPTLLFCDRILVLESGVVSAFAPHAEVLIDNEFYAHAVHASRI